MKKLYIILSALILASLVLAACQPAAQETEPPPPTAAPAATQAPAPTEVMEDMLPDLGGREVTVAIENAYLPFNYVLLDTGEPGGWDYDFLEEACNRLNCVPVFVEFQWDPMIQAVADGQFDMAADGITITEDRAKVVDFSDGYVALAQQILGRVDEDRYSNIDDFAADSELLIGTQIGTTNYDTALEFLPENRIIAFDTFPLAIQALRSGDVDGVMIDNVAGLGYQGEYGEELAMIGDALTSEELGFVFPKGSDLVAPFNAVLDQMKGDGSLQELNARWFGPTFDVTYEEIADGAYAVDIGTVDNPIKVLFVPSVDTQAIVSGGEIMADALKEATGLEFEVVVPTSYAATIEEMCAAPDSSMGFIPGLGYVLANQLCGVDVAYKAVRFGWSVYWAQYIVPRDSDAQTLADLDGLKWAYPDAGSTSGYMVPLVEFQENGITPGETLEAGGHTGTVRASLPG